jgi:hypothetical protein
MQIYQEMVLSVRHCQFRVYWCDYFYIFDLDMDGFEELYTLTHFEQAGVAFDASCY